MSGHSYIDNTVEDHNPSDNDLFASVVALRGSRRDILKGAFGMAAAGMLAGIGIGCGGSDSAGSSSFSLSFNAVSKSTGDTLVVPSGYTAKVLFRTGDPINTSVAAYANDGTDINFANRSGDHHDGMHFFGLNTAGTAWDASQSAKGLLVLNHEVAEDLGFMHVNGQTDATDRPTTEIDKEVEAHGVSIIEVVSQNGSYDLNLSSSFNKRITASTVMEIHGPVRGSDMAKTAYSTDGTKTRGTINNCAHGYTPWGTYLTCEENWAGYFYRNDSGRDVKEESSFSRYGIKGNASVSKGRYNWARPTGGDTTDIYRRWNASVVGATGTDDFRNVANTFGWVVEIDPFKPSSTPRKRTTLGRMGHEGCYPAPAVAGKPLVFYMGDDARNEYIYKFVTTENWSASDINGGLTAGDKYLNSGTLYVAKFNADGTGTWLPITIENSTIENYTSYSFSDAADVLINTRHAADALGATKMDRPEWGGIHPLTGEVYMALTNSVSSSSGRGRVTPLDAANPRYYDEDGSLGNVNGHVIRWKESGGNHAATSFQWDIYLFGAESDTTTTANISELSADNDFSSPDGLWFSAANPGLLWLQTDDGAYTDKTNCMMLAAVPGSVGDGGAKTITNTAVPANGGADQEVSTFVGKPATTTTLRRFLVGPKDCEVTGIAETPDGKAIFVNIQHPGERSTSATTGYTSNWPDGGSARPRSATVVITRDDGGKVGV